VGHVLSLLILGWRRWGLRDILPASLGLRPPTVHLTPVGAVFITVECVFVGLAWARSLHYQFYVTYYWTLPILVVSATQHRWLPDWATMLLRLALVGAIESSFLAYPTTARASTILAAAHTVLLVSMFTSSLPRGAIRRSASANKKYA
jgi:alpha-1,3-mannosyltransferase